MERKQKHSVKEFDENEKKEFSVGEESGLEGLSTEELVKRIKNLEEIMRTEIEKRDKIIEELKKKNEILLRTALKQSMKNEELKSLFERMKIKEKNNKRE